MRICDDIWQRECRDEPPARLNCHCAEILHAEGMALHGTYIPDLGRFAQPDPNAGDYHGISPYVYCGGDPVNYTDPDGNDWYVINREGYLVETIANDTDQFFLKNENGNNTELTKSYEKGTFEVSSNDSSDKSVKILSIKLNGNAIGTEVFEALACNTSVEWGLIQADKTGIEENYIGTSHHEKEENSSSYHLTLYMSPNTHDVRAIIHSHPSGTEGPSGVIDSSGDIGFAKKYEQLYPSATFSTYVPHKGYFPYSSTSTPEEYSFKGVLDEVVITPKSK